jgi:S-formylglutathione hydrolase FrmB
LHVIHHSLPPPATTPPTHPQRALQTQLKPDALEEACKAAGYPATLRLQEGYDHSYFFISTFIDDHIAHHAAALKAK